MVTKGNVFDPNCPTRVILDRIGDKWTVLAVLLLRDGPLRFTELRDGIGGSRRRYSPRRCAGWSATA